MAEPVSADVQEAIAWLKRLTEERPELAGPSRLYLDLLPGIFSHVPKTNSIGPSQDRLGRLVEGVPLFRDRPPQLDERLLRGRFDQVITVLSRHRDPLVPRQLARTLFDSGTRLSEMLNGIFANGDGEFTEFLTSRALDSSLGLSVLRLCALPVLASLVSEIEASCGWPGWTRGYCPACGSWPLLAEFRGLEQFRWLRCGLCSAGWKVDRMFCPFCESRDHRLLQDWSADDEPQRNRVTTCDACRGFVRGISTLTPISAPGLLVAELETLHLELIAQERGFKLGGR